MLRGKRQAGLVARDNTLSVLVQLDTDALCGYAVSTAGWVRSCTADWISAVSTWLAPVACLPKIYNLWYTMEEKYTLKNSLLPLNTTSATINTMIFSNVKAKISYPVHKNLIIFIF